MPSLSRFFGSLKDSRPLDGGFFENCCKAPKNFKIEPPLPNGYSAWIHRVGWVLYVHEPTKQRSWMHPVKLANLEARGLKGPGKIGPEMWIWEKDVNRGGYYVVDYGYPPMGRIVSSRRPFPQDLKIIDEIGWDAWQAKEKAHSDEYHRKHDAEALKRSQERTPEDLEKLREKLTMRRKMMEEQGIISEFGIHVNDKVVDLTAQEMDSSSTLPAEEDPLNTV